MELVPTMRGDCASASPDGHLPTRGPSLAAHLAQLAGTRVAWLAMIGDSLSRKVFATAVHALGLVNEPLTFNKTTYHNDHIVSCALTRGNGTVGPALQGCRLLNLGQGGDVTLSAFVQAEAGRERGRGNLLAIVSWQCRWLLPHLPVTATTWLPFRYPPDGAEVTLWLAP